MGSKKLHVLKNNYDLHVHLSAAFDTVDHSVLLLRLQTSFGISGEPLDWF